MYIIIIIIIIIVRYLTVFRDVQRNQLRQRLEEGCRKPVLWSSSASRHRITIDDGMSPVLIIGVFILQQKVDSLTIILQCSAAKWSIPGRFVFGSRRWSPLALC